MDGQAARAASVVHDFIGGETGVGAALTEIATLATEAIGSDMAGLTLVDDSGRATTVVYTDHMAPEVDQAQYDSDRGPCLNAFRERHVVPVADMDDEQRWPEYARAAAAHGIRTSLSVPIVVGGRGIGALNFYGRERRSLDGDAAIAIGTLFARHASIVAAYFDRAEEADNLQRALESRAEIDQAKGIIMATSGGSADDAFELLRQQSQSQNRKLRDIAQELVARQQRTER